MTRRDPVLIEIDAIDRDLRSISPATSTYRRLAARKLELERKAGI